MTDLGNDGLKGVQIDANQYEDEINLMDYFLVLWKRKWCILAASVLPALVVVLAMFLGARNYKISYTYNAELNEKAFKILEDKFYSMENLEKLIVKLQEAGFNKYAEKLAKARTAEDLKKFVYFEVSPSLFKVTDTSEVKDFEELQKIQIAKGTLLVMHIVAKAGE
ncbi:MAG: hypothetical protein PHP01_05885, partial [Phycisphaerae bacterium]|nr:hypothetical protein [Phycisphaerae bacterium]